MMMAILQVALSHLLVAQNSPATGFGAPGIAFGDGTTYIADVGHNMILERTADGSFRPFLHDSRIKSVRGLAADGTYLYVADPLGHQVFRVNQKNKAISVLLPPNVGATPFDVTVIPTYYREDQAEKTAGKLAILDAKTNSLLLLDSSESGKEQAKGATNRRFEGPTSLSQYGGSLFVTDTSAGIIFKTSDPSFSRWENVRTTLLGTPDVTRTSEAPGFFFPILNHPESIAGYSSFFYVLADHKLYAYLPKRDRLVPLANDKHETPMPERIAISEDPEELILLGSDPQDYRSWPILIPITVEAATESDPSDSMSAIYGYLLRDGHLPVASIKTPENGCGDAACLIEDVRRLSPKMNAGMERLFCDLNPLLCSDSKAKRIPFGATVILPDVPFEPSLSVAQTEADGHSSISSYVMHNVPDPELRRIINDSYISDLNPGPPLKLDLVPLAKTILRLPVQVNRYYLSVPKGDLYSATSGLAQVLQNFPGLRVTPFGTTSKSAAGKHAMSDVAVQDIARLTKLETDLLKHIGMNEAHRGRYGVANDVPVLIAESDIDCRHPVFFGPNGPEDHAFNATPCVHAKSAQSSAYAEFSLNDHGTCVASIIGGRSSPYGQSLASGADLDRIEDASIGVSNLVSFYNREKQPFVVNVSSGDRAITALSNWRDLLSDPFVKKAVLVVAAADNDRAPLESVKRYPAYLSAEYLNLVSVGALNSKGDSIWQDPSGQQGSNFGPRVDLLAPGEDVPCAEEVSQEQARYSSPSGTSFAAPIVTSVAALLLQKKLSPIEVKARLLATAEPNSGQLWGQPYSRFGRLSIDDALLSPKMSHLFYEQDGVAGYIEGDMRDTVAINFRDPSAVIQTWERVDLDKLLSIRRESNTPLNGLPLYRLIMFDGTTISMKDRVELNGCLSVDDRASGIDYILKFEAGCPEQGTVDRSTVKEGLIKFIAPTFGEFKSQEVK